jgi:hypothetical protein
MLPAQLNHGSSRGSIGPAKLPWQLSHFETDSIEASPGCVPGIWTSVGTVVAPIADEASATHTLSVAQATATRAPARSATFRRGTP